MRTPTNFWECEFWRNMNIHYLQNKNGCFFFFCNRSANDCADYGTLVSPADGLKVYSWRQCKAPLIINLINMSSWLLDSSCTVQWGLCSDRDRRSMHRSETGEGSMWTLWFCAVHSSPFFCRHLAKLVIFQQNTFFFLGIFHTGDFTMKMFKCLFCCGKWGRWNEILVSYYFAV